MEEQVDRLVEKTWAKYQNTPPDQRLLIAVSGIPGSGKTTLALTITTRLNALHTTLHGKTTSPPPATFVPMDGYHFPRSELDKFPDPKNAHDRRGAAFTFDGEAFLKLVQQIRKPITKTTPPIHAPSFDHALKDPVYDDIPIPPTARIVIFEGNYLSLNTEPWSQAAALMDELWFVNVTFPVAGARLVPRHVKAGIAPTEELAWKRVNENDLVNGQEIVDNRLEVHEVIESKEDDSWKPSGI
ncbi:P-loop containing nucleoside triphosphate hydrolase [Glarea lozoyensis ATCC 20868]|uniref:p-loop containing nucleoside triphosphate hydrolase n=1 Tax=Glarea lozoyensis (strain ATCC 20868 / MF5171) TaxID=1116229 RepID=S3DC28_GLAL2|nr:P-loop containing nucleoside triphosphate hydrolase [Glarea lozoyensis ATCC 20868]EPE35982.1 P-loop containing nucleoside triphosphate hydrolase [Glarea lozoyensis ATCC 20868]